MFQLFLFVAVINSAVRRNDNDVSELWHKNLQNSMIWLRFCDQFLSESMENGSQKYCLKLTEPESVPGCGQGADSGEEDRRLHVHMDAQRQLPVVALHFARSSRVLAVQHCLQSLEKKKQKKDKNE